MPLQIKRHLQHRKLPLPPMKREIPLRKAVHIKLTQRHAGHKVNRLRIIPLIPNLIRSVAICKKKKTSFTLRRGIL